MKKIATYASYAGLILLLFSLINYSTGNVWNLVSWITCILGFLCLVFFGIFRWALIKETLFLRSIRYGGNTLAMSLILLAILSIVNFIANRHSVRWDLTAGGQFSLSPQTQQVLQNLDVDVRVTAFYQSDAQQQIRDLLESYGYHSNNFKVEFVDPDSRPTVAKRYGVTAYETVVLETDIREEQVTSPEEQDITNALIKVTREGKKVVYFLEGHGEKNINDEEQGGYSQTAEGIRQENYDVKKLLLAEEKSIPQECNVLVIGGPAKNLFTSELDTIQTYLENGGNALFMLDPDPSPGFTRFFDQWGLEIGNDMVLDVSGVGQLFGMGPTVPLVSTYEDHEIMRNFQVMTFFPHARSVTPREETESGLSVESLMKTSSNSWGETNLRDEKADFDEDADLPGPVSLAAVVTKDAASDSADQIRASRIVVVGDSDFASNAYWGSQGNSDLFLNIIGWLAEEEDLISIRPKQPEDRRVFLSALQMKWVMYFTVIILPLAALAAGIAVYMKRERRER